MTHGVPDRGARADRAGPAPETPLDAAHRAQEADPGAAGPRQRFCERVLDAELFLLLEDAGAEDVEAHHLHPRVFELAEGRFVLAFDLDSRLAEFLEAPVPYAALPGRRLVAMLAGRGIGIGLNLGAAPSATLLPAEAIDWMADLAGAPPVEEHAVARTVGAPRAAPAALIAALDVKLAAMAAQIGAAHLVAAEFGTDAGGLLLVLVGVRGADQAAVAAGIAEAVRFSGAEATRLDVTFLGSGAPSLAAIRAVGLEFELPPPAATVPATPRAPGSDPDQPPILRRGPRRPPE